MVIVADGQVYRHLPFGKLEHLGPVHGATAAVAPDQAHRLGAARDTSLVLGWAARWAVP